MNIRTRRFRTVTLAIAMGDTQSLRRLGRKGALKKAEIKRQKMHDEEQEMEALMDKLRNSIDVETGLTPPQIEAHERECAIH